jgi:hypothetical protein
MSRRPGRRLHTVPARQCMAPGPDAAPAGPAHAQSIKPYLQGDDEFCWNYGLALAAVSRHAEAAEQLLAVRSEAYRWAGGGGPAAVPGVDVVWCCWTDCWGCCHDGKTADGWKQWLPGAWRRAEPCYQGWLARCLVGAGRAGEAWELYTGCEPAMPAFAACPRLSCALL